MALRPFPDRISGNNKMVRRHLVLGSVLLILGWSMGPLFKKWGSRRISSLEYLIAQEAFIVVFLCLAVLVRFGISSKHGFNAAFWQRPSATEFACIGMAALCAVVPALVLVWLLKEHKVSVFMPIIQPLTIICTTCASIVVMGEAALTRNQLLSMLLILTGVASFLYAT